MLTILGLGMILCFMYLIMSRKMTALAALTLIPIVFALLTYGLSFYMDGLGHFEIKDLGEMMLDGVKNLHRQVSCCSLRSCILPS